MTLSRATQAFALYCFLVAIYLSVGGYFQAHWGLWGLAFNETVFLALPSILFVALTGLSFAKTLPWRLPSFQDVLIVLVATALVIVPMELLVHYQEKIWPLPQEVESFYEKLILHRSFGESVLKLFLLAILPAVCEELFFRGLLLSLLRPSFGPVQTVLLTALFFAVAHANPWYFPYYFVLGIFLGWVRQWRDNLALCMLAHFANNLYSIYGQG